MRKKTVEVAGKKFVIEERKIGELAEILRKIQETGSEAAGLNDFNDLIDFVFGKGVEVLSLLIPGITDKDIKNAYPSEIEEAIKAWVDVNFFGLKKLGGALMSYVAFSEQKK
jgi:hypothetical protein